MSSIGCTKHKNLANFQTTSHMGNGQDPHHWWLEAYICTEYQAISETLYGWVKVNVFYFWSPALLPEVIQDLDCSSPVWICLTLSAKVCTWQNWRGTDYTGAD